MIAEAHLAEILLRRQRAGELEEPERIDVLAHLDRCGHCRGRLSAMEEEQRAFEREISFERFSAGVERAARESRRPTPSARAAWLYPAMAVAATLTVMVLAEPVSRLVEPKPRMANRVKGGAGVDLRIAPAGGGPQRTATAEGAEPIIPGEHLRLMYRSGGRGYVMAVTVDEDGAVGPLHPEAGVSEPVTGAADALHYLPAFELTGRGAERVVVILSDGPLRFEEVRAAAESAFAAAGRDLTRMGDLPLEGEQFHRTLLKQ